MRILVALALLALQSTTSVPVRPDLASSAAVEQTSHGTKPALPLLAQFGGLGFGLVADQKTPPLPRNPSDNSLAGTPHFAGQRMAARLADDPPGLLTFRETVLAEGEAAQTNTLRWEDYTQTAMDPSDDCTIWYVGDYLKKGASSYSTRIGAVRLPGCMDR